MGVRWGPSSFHQRGLAHRRTRASTVWRPGLGCLTFARSRGRCAQLGCRRRWAATRSRRRAVIRTLSSGRCDRAGDQPPADEGAKSRAAAPQGGCCGRCVSCSLQRSHRQGPTAGGAGGAPAGRRSGSGAAVTLSVVSPCRTRIEQESEARPWHVAQVLASAPEGVGSHPAGADPSQRWAGAGGTTSSAPRESGRSRRPQRRSTWSRWPGQAGTQAQPSRRCCTTCCR